MAGCFGRSMKNLGWGFGLPVSGFPVGCHGPCHRPAAQPGNSNIGKLRREGANRSNGSWIFSLRWLVVSEHNVPRYAAMSRHESIEPFPPADLPSLSAQKPDHLRHI